MNAVIMWMGKHVVDLAHRVAQIQSDDVKAELSTNSFGKFKAMSKIKKASRFNRTT